MTIQISEELMQLYDFAKVTLVLVAFFALAGLAGSGLGYALFSLLDLIKAWIKELKEKCNGKDKDDEHRPGNIQ